MYREKFLLRLLERANDDIRLDPSEANALTEIKWTWETIEKFVNMNLTRETITQWAQKYSPPLRERTEQFFMLANNWKVPILVLSAGIGDVIKAVLSEETSLPSNVKIAANWFTYDQNQVSGMGDVKNHIYSFNKHEGTPQNGQEYFPDWNTRPNVIVMGDSLGDAKMADGFKNTKNVLKIGFCGKTEVLLHR